jgi:hypothetical protein
MCSTFQIHTPLKTCPYCAALLPPVYLVREVNEKEPLRR